MTSASNWVRILVACSIGLFSTTLPQLVCAQSKSDWEDTPYRVEIWFAVEGPDLTVRFESRLQRFLADRSDVVFGPTWAATIAAPNPQVRSQMIADLGGLTIDQMAATDEEFFKKRRDKLILISIRSTPLEYRISARELDIRTRILGPVIERSQGQAGILMYDAYDALVQAFLPIARVDDVEPKVAMLRVRASGLFYGEPRPCSIPRSSVMMPVVRINDRYGEPTKGGITVVPWTYLYLPKEIPQPVVQVEEKPNDSQSNDSQSNDTQPKDTQPKDTQPKDTQPKDTQSSGTKRAVPQQDARPTGEASGSADQPASPDSAGGEAEQNKANPLARRVKDLTWQAQIYTGRRGALGGKTGSRLERYALLVKPTRKTTTVIVRSRATPPVLLEGYELYAKNPLIESAESGQEPEQQSPAELLGRTDWRGSLSVGASAEFPVRMLYVRSGGQLLAKLPLVVGSEREVVAEVSNDDQRLAVEGFCLGIQALVMDSVARRELLASRIRKRIEEKKLDEAQKLLEDLSNLPTKESLMQRVSARQSNVTIADRTNQARIDKLFADVTNLVNKYIDRSLPEKLMAELSKARAGGE